jgi:signal transduction histidine kinase
MRLIDRRNASATERQRIMQDMHDGLGAQLVPWLVMVERGGAKPADIAMLLRESLDEMRLAIDAFGKAETDLNGTLAGLRYRMERRLIAAGMAVEWSVDDPFHALQLDERTALQLLRIVQEVLSNVIKHSRATASAFASRLTAAVFGEGGRHLEAGYSTVTLLARFLGLSTSVPLARAAW